jgi:hypothetical protein
LDRGVDHERIVEFGQITRPFSGYWQKAGGQRLVPLERQRGHVADNQIEGVTRLNANPKLGVISQELRFRAI